MNILLTLIQVYFEKDAKSSSDQIRDVAFKFADKGKDVALAAALWFLAALFVFSGLVLFVVEIGLQIDKEQFFNFSGLVISSFVLISISIFCVLISLFVLRETEVKQPEPKSVKPSDELKQAVYDIALMFLREFKVNHQKSSENHNEKS